MPTPETIIWKNDKVVMIDQRVLPLKIVFRTYTNHKQVAIAIKKMVIRGAPAIGVAAAMGIALGAKNIKAKTIQKFEKEFQSIVHIIRHARPTAVNLGWACDKMENFLKTHKSNDLSIEQIKKELIKEAQKMYLEDIAINKNIGKNGAVLLKKSCTVLTHCNAGALATAGYGTALGVIRYAKESGKDIKVFADETRPFLQGARLTVWELQQEKIPVTLITDNMAGYFMSKGVIDAIVVGADRIASNGDTANKIGTYSLSVLAKENNIPFYIAAPLSTIDTKIKTGKEIPIEERPTNEVTSVFGKKIVSDNTKVANPAFDVTPFKYITAIITEKGVIQKPYKENIEKLFRENK